MLISEKLAGKQVATSLGLVNFDANGVSNDLKEKEQKELHGIASMEYVEDVQAQSVEPAKEAVPKEEPKKKPAKKTTKKATKKKEEK